MNLGFKVMFQKPWTLLDDRILYGDKVILLSDIQSARLVSQAQGMINGVIEISVNGRSVLLGYPAKQAFEGDQALSHICRNCGRESSYGNHEEVNHQQQEVPQSNQGTNRQQHTMHTNGQTRPMTAKEEQMFQQQMDNIFGANGVFTQAMNNGLADGKTAAATNTTSFSSSVTGCGQTKNSVSAADELLKYKQLLDMGAITQEEFAKKKKELLG